MHHRLARPVPVALVGQHHQANGGAVPLERVVESLALYGKGPRIVVGLPVDQEQRGLNLMHVHEGRHRRVDLRRLPEGTLLGLEAERRQGAVERAASGDAGPEEIGVGEQVGRHKRAIGVPAGRNAVPVGHAATHHLLHRGRGAGHELLDVRIVGFLLALTHDRHSRSLEDSISMGQQEQRGSPVGPDEAVRRTRDLARCIRALEFTRVGPHQHRQGPVFGSVAGGQVEGGRQLHSVVARIANQLFVDARQLRGRMRERRNLSEFVARQVPQKEVGWLGDRLPAGHKLKTLDVDEMDGMFVTGALRAPEPLRLTGLHIEPV